MEDVSPKTVVVPVDAGPNYSDSTLPLAMIEAGMAVLDQVDADNADYVAGETTDWDQGMVVVAIYRAMLAAAPAPLPGGLGSSSLKGEDTQPDSANTVAQRPAGHCDDDAAWAEFERQYRGQPRSRPDLTDFALANAVFMADRWDLDLIVYQAAAKERIRWLSLRLAEALNQQAPTPASVSPGTSAASAPKTAADWIAEHERPDPNDAEAEIASLRLQLEQARSAPNLDAGVVGDLLHAADLLRAAKDAVDKITMARRDIGPLATQAQTAGHAIGAAITALAKYATQGTGGGIWNDAMRKIGEDHLARATHQPAISTDRSGPFSQAKIPGGDASNGAADHEGAGE